MPIISSGLRLTYRGTWSSGTLYRINDVVVYGGSSYVAVAASTGVTPGTDTAYWGLLAEEGDPGPSGPAGSVGATGPVGASGTVSVGTVTTGAPGSGAAVTNSGTPSAAVLDFSIPRGESATSLAVVSRTTAYTANANELVLCNASAAGFVVKLPATAAAGDRVMVKKTDVTGNLVQVQSNTGTTLDNGPSTGSLFAPDQAAEYAWTGSAWRSITTRPPMSQASAPVMAAGSWYDNQTSGGGFTAKAINLQMQFMPCYVPRTVVVDAVGMYCTAVGNANPVTMGFYSIDRQSGLPSALLSTTFTVTPASGNVVAYATGTPVTINSGWFALAVNQYNGSTTTWAHANIGTTPAFGQASTPPSVYPTLFWTTSYSASGTLPTTVSSPVPGANVTIPRVFFRVAS